jgi:hypothetical protein
MGQRREVRAAKAAAVRAIDPERDLRAAREALEWLIRRPTGWRWRTGSPSWSGGPRPFPH